MVAIWDSGVTGSGFSGYATWLTPGSRFLNTSCDVESQNVSVHFPYPVKLKYIGLKFLMALLSCMIL